VYDRVIDSTICAYRSDCHAFDPFSVRSTGSPRFEPIAPPICCANDQQRAAKWKKNIAMHNGGLQLTSEFF
jgi:hypothetical protein